APEAPGFPSVASPPRCCNCRPNGRQTPHRALEYHTLPPYPPARRFPSSAPLQQSLARGSAPPSLPPAPAECQRDTPPHQSSLGGCPRRDSSASPSRVRGCGVFLRSDRRVPPPCPRPTPAARRAVRCPPRLLSAPAVAHSLPGPLRLRESRLRSRGVWQSAHQSAAATPGGAAIGRPAANWGNSSCSHLESWPERSVMTLVVRRHSAAQKIR